MATFNLDAADLAAVDFNGLINEDVMQQIWDISFIPLPFSDRVSNDSTENAYTEWTQDKLQDPDLTNAFVDGQDTISEQDTNTGLRVGNQHQISIKVVKVSTRARDSDTIGRSDELAYQIMMRQRELRRDVEAISLENQASVADDGDSVAGLVGTFGAWLETNTFRGAGGADGGFSAGVVDAPTPGTARAGTETLIRDMAQSIWEQGGNPTALMSTPSAIRGLSEFMFTSSARIATLQRNEQGMTAGVAIGSVNVFLTDFGVTLEMIPNRLQQTHVDAVATQVVDVYGMDFEFVRHGTLSGPMTEELQKSGLADNRQMEWDWTLKMLNEAAQGTVADVDPTLAWTVS